LFPVYVAKEGVFVENMPGKKQDSQEQGTDNPVTVAVPEGITLERSLIESNRKLHNTPNEGTIRVRIEQTGRKLFLKVEDSGIGITDKDKIRIFEGLFHARHSDLYGTVKPYDFNAGGKGLDLLLMDIYGQHLGFDLAAESKHCTHIPTARDTCPGQISRCPHCKGREDCAEAGWSIFTLTFPTTSIFKGETP